MSTARTGMRGDAPTVTITPPTAEKPIREVKSDAPTVTIKEGEDVEVPADMVRAILNAAPTEEEHKYNK